PLAPGLRLALRTATANQEISIRVRLLRECARLGAESYASSASFLGLLDSLEIQSSSLDSETRSLVLRVLDFMAMLPGETACELFERVFVSPDADHSLARRGPSPILARILDATEGILSTDAASAARLLQCGVEYMEVGDEAVVDRWIEFCEYLDRRGLNVLSQFCTGTIDSTRTLVRLALKDSENSRTICLAAINASRHIADRSIPAAAYCYQQSSILLAQLSVDSFEEWVRF